MAKNTICLWYDKDAEAAARFYAETFPDSAVSAIHRAPGDYPSGKKGDEVMLYIAPVKVGDPIRYYTKYFPATIEPHHATEAAKFLIASASVHAQKFALAMHGRVSRGLNADLIEHWARVVMEIDRIGPHQATPPGAGDK